MIFVSEISDLQLSLMIASAALTLLATIAILVRVLPLKRLFRKHNSETVSPVHPVSAAVIIFTHDDDESLAEMLPQILGQQYEPGFEVIVVNDGESSLVRDLVEQLTLCHPNLYFTAAPDGARNLSRKKLALTLGIKAAKSQVVVLTTSAARINSKLWLRSIMRHFDPDGAVDVVIGYANAPAYDDRSFGARARAFDSMAHDLGWIAPAAAGRPWRGSEHNLAYRRELFFHNKGFSRHLNLRDGDDDIFISEISRGYNTVADLSNDSFVEVPGANISRALKDRLERHRFTKKFISRRPHLAGTVSTIAYFLAPLPLVAVPFIGRLDTFGWIYLAAIFVCWYAAGMLWSFPVRAMHVRKLLFSIPLLAFTRPFRIFRRTASSMTRRSKRYTWE